MQIDIPVKDFKFYHNWVSAPLGSVLRVTDAQGADQLGLRCLYREGQTVTHLVFISDENGHGFFLRENELSTGAVDVSENFDLVVVDPKITPVSTQHQAIYGSLLSTGTGELYCRAQMGGHAGFMRLDTTGPAGNQYMVDFFHGAPQGARFAGVLGFRPKPIALNAGRNN